MIADQVSGQRIRGSEPRMRMNYEDITSCPGCLTNLGEGKSLEGEEGGDQ